MRYLLLTLALLPLVSCSSAEEQAQKEEAKEIEQCTKAGFQQGTPQFDDCRLQVQQIEDQKRADRIAASDHVGQFQNNYTGTAPPSPVSGYSIPMR